MNPEIAAVLVRRGEELFRADSRPLNFTANQEADALLNDLEHHPHAFVLACVLDRQVKAERAWVIPYRLSQALGGFSFPLLQTLSTGDFHQLLTKPQVLHRFPEEMSRNLHSAINLIATAYGGDAGQIWSGTPSSAHVVMRFLRFRGVGPKIATMATNILARNFKIPFADYYSIDVSADVHIRRVFARLGFIAADASTEEAIYAARALHPRFPGLMDFPAWEIGRQWCRPTAPRCPECYMQSFCPAGQEMSTAG